MGQHFTLGAGPAQIMGQHVLPRLYVWIVEKRGQTGKKVWDDTLEGVGTSVKAIKSDSGSDSDVPKTVVDFWEEETRGDTAELATEKGRQVLSGKNKRTTPSVAAPGVTTSLVMPMAVVMIIKNFIKFLII